MGTKKNSKQDLINSIMEKLNDIKNIETLEHFDRMVLVLVQEQNEQEIRNNG